MGLLWIGGVFLVLWLVCLAVIWVAEKSEDDPEVWVEDLLS